jgi:hypothetical protein
MYFPGATKIRQGLIPRLFSTSCVSILIGYILDKTKTLYVVVAF